MKICLVSPPWVITRRGNIWNYVRGTMPPLGILYIASYLEKHNVEVDVIDFVPQLYNWEEIEKKIAAFDYDWVGITGTTPIISHTYRIAELVKKHHPSTKVVVGGVHVSALPEEALALPFIDYVVRGEGEVAFHQLVTGVPVENIQGLSYKADGENVHIGVPGIVKDIENLPMPAYHKLDLSIYKPAVGAYKRLPAINMMALRGCVGKCTFCNSADVAQRKRSAQHIFDEIETLTSNFGVKEITFYDDTFTVYRKNVVELCKLIIDNNIDVTWSCFGRTDCVTPEMLHYMKKAGCHQILFGIETANQEIAKNIRKPIKNERNSKAIQWAKDEGINVRCSFMFGNQGETEETIEQTIQYSLELDPDIVMFNITTPYPGTQLFDWAKQNGYLRTENWDEYDFSEPVLQLPTIENNNLLNEKYKEAYRRFYFRPRYLLKKLKKVGHFKDFQLLFEGFRAVSNFIR